MDNYTTTIHCPVSAEQAYRAISEEMSSWWTPMSGLFKDVGDKARTDFGGDSYWVFTAKTLNSPNLIELECVESRMIMDILDDPGEWLGTILRFEISGSDASAEIVFTHLGLNQEMQCFEVCEAGWNHYIPGSLRDYLHGEGGKPNSY